MIESTKSGSFLTEKGQKISKQIQKVIPNECQVKKCNLIPGKNNHAIILKDYAFAIKSGLEQRDYAILYGSSGCITILFQENKFVFPREDKDCFHNAEFFAEISATNGSFEDDTIMTSPFLGFRFSKR